MYADYCRLGIRCKRVRRNYRRDTNLGKKWTLGLNQGPGKTNLMALTDFDIQNIITPVNVCQEYKYLGVVLEVKELKDGKRIKVNKRVMATVKDRINGSSRK